MAVDDRILVGDRITIIINKNGNEIRKRKLVYCIAANLISVNKLVRECLIFQVTHFQTFEEMIIFVRKSNIFIVPTSVLLSIFFHSDMEGGISFHDLLSCVAEFLKSCPHVIFTKKGH